MEGPGGGPNDPNSSENPFVAPLGVGLMPKQWWFEGFIRTGSRKVAWIGEKNLHRLNLLRDRCIFS